MIYKIGQILTSKVDTVVKKALSDEEVVIPKGNKIIIGADNFAHYIKNGMLQPLAKGTEVKGYDCEGIAEYLYLCLKSHLPLNEMLEDYEVDEKTFMEEIECALDEILQERLNV